MSKKQAQEKKVTSNRLLPTVLYGLTVLLFSFAYIFNNQLKNSTDAQFHTDARGAYDYVLPHESYYFIVAMIMTLIMIRVVQWSVASLKHFTRSKLSLLGLVFYGITFICIADFLVSPWGFPRSCGDGFNQGNCFLADGLSEMIYFAIIPLCFIVGTGLFIAHKRMKVRSYYKE